LIGFVFRPFRNILNAPLVLKKLFLADLFSWMGIFALFYFATDFFATVVYGVKADAKSPEDLSRYEEGVRMGSFGLMLHSIVACLFSLLLQERLINCAGLKNSYLIGLATFSLCMVTSVAFPSVWVVCLCNAVSGIGTAVAQHVPATLVTLYQSHPDVFYADVEARHGTAYNLSVIDAGYYLSQIILSLTAGLIVESTGINQMYMVISAVCGAGRLCQHGGSLQPAH